MASAADEQDDPPASLSTYAALLLQALRANYRLQLELELVREQADGRLEALQTAVALLAESGKDSRRARENTQALREELRRYVAAHVSTASSRAA